MCHGKLFASNLFGSMLNTFCTYRREEYPLGSEGSKFDVFLFYEFESPIELQKKNEIRHICHTF